LIKFSCCLKCGVGGGWWELFKTCELNWPVVEWVDTRSCLERGEWNGLSI